MTKDDLIQMYNKKRNEAIERHQRASRKLRDSVDPELKEYYAIEKEYFISRKHFCEEVLRDLHDLRCGC